MKTAVQKHDGEALSEHVDFPSLRQSLKEQINIMLSKEMSGDAESNPLAGLGAVLGGAFTDKIVDTYVSPAGLTELLKGDKPNFDESENENTPSDAVPFEGAKLSYQSFAKFYISSIDPDTGDESKFILRRKGLSWKLSELLIIPHVPQPTKENIVGKWEGNNHFNPETVRKNSTPQPPLETDISDTFIGEYTYHKDGTYTSSGKHIRSIRNSNNEETVIFLFQGEGIWSLHGNQLLKTTKKLSAQPGNEHTKSMVEAHPEILDQIANLKGKTEPGEILMLTESKLKVLNNDLEYTFTKKR